MYSRTMDKKNGWWEYDPLRASEYQDLSLNWASNAMLREMGATSREGLHRYAIRGPAVEGVEVLKNEKLQELLMKAEFRLLQATHTSCGHNVEDPTTRLDYVSHNGFLSILDNGEIHVSFVVKAEELAIQLRDQIKSMIRVEEPADEPGTVYTMARNAVGQYSFQHVGVTGAKFYEDNYIDEVVKGYNLIHKNLTSEDPDGRLYILNGEPGTGKTYFVRSLIEATSGVNFVLVPPSLLQHLGDPEIIPALVSSLGSSPTCLILEDADTCLVKRHESNLPSISSLLNLSDGILGSLLNIHILATTNAKKVEIDEAALRDGRLGAHLVFQPLPGPKAEAVYSRISEGKRRQFRDKIPIAAVYKQAKQTLRELDR